MLNIPNSRVVLKVSVEQEGSYWVVRCPSLGMVAAHRQKAAAFMRASRMFPAQVIYALNQDPELTSLFVDGHDQEAEVLRACQQKRQPFALVFEQTPAGGESSLSDTYRYELPGVLTA